MTNPAPIDDVEIGGEELRLGQFDKLAGLLDSGGTVNEAIIEGLKKIPEVLEVKIQAGREDLLVHVAISSLEAMQVLTSAIVNIDGVRKTTSTFSVATPIPFRVQPLLEHVTSDAGWGRSTPAVYPD